MPAEFKDYYSTLGVARDATEEEIKKAYEILGAPKKREQYDRLGERWQESDFHPPPRRQGGAAAGANRCHGPDGRGAAPRILVYCRHGLLAPLEEPTPGYHFDDEAIRRLRQIEYLRGAGLNLPGLKLALELMHEVERLQAEVRFLRR